MSDDQTMTAQHPDHWIYEMLNDLRTDMTEQHRRLREDMHGGFETLRVEMRGQNGRMGKAENRLTIIETARDADDRQAMKRGTWAGIVSAAGLTGLIEAIREWR